MLWEISILIPIAASSKSTIAALPIHMTSISFFSEFGSVMDFLLLDRNRTVCPRRARHARFKLWRPGNRRNCHLYHFRSETKPQLDGTRRRSLTAGSYQDAVER